MKNIKNNIPDVLIVVAVVLMSIGTFLFSVPIGFIGTGLMITGIAYLVHLKGGD